MRNRYRCLAVAICAIAFTLCVLPIMSIVTDGPESGVLTIRGCNLLSMSAWGAIPFFAPLAMAAILFGHQISGERETQLLLLCMASMVSYVHSVLVSREWLVSVGESLIDYQIGILLYPLGLLGAFAIAFALCGMFGRSPKQISGALSLPKLIE